MKPEVLSHIIDKIYAASLEPHMWEEVSRDIQYAIGGSVVNFVVEDTELKQFRYVFSNAATESDVAFYLEHIVHDDALTGLLETLPRGKAFLTQNILPLKQLEKVSAYDRFYRRIGQTYFNAANCYRRQQVRAFISVARSHFDSPFHSLDQQNLQLLIPHLSRALTISDTVTDQQATIGALSHSFEHLPCAVLMLDGQGKLLMFNHRAEPFIARLKQLRSDYLIRLPSSTATQRLHDLIDSALYRSGYLTGGSVVFHYQGEQYVAHCFPWCHRFNHADWVDTRARCLIFVVSAAYLAGTDHHWQNTFGFSQAEGNIANGLICGHSVKELADRLFISESTVRFHVKNILKKTETKSQVSAVSLMLRSLMVVRH